MDKGGQGKAKITVVWIWKKKFYLHPSCDFWGLKPKMTQDKKTNPLIAQVWDLLVVAQTLIES